MIRFLKKITDDEYIFSVIAKILGVFIGLVFTVLYNRYLGPELRGQAAIIMNFVNLISIFMGLGIYQAYPWFKKTEGDIYEKFIAHTISMFLFYGVCAIFLLQFPIDTNLKVAFIILPMTVTIKQLNYIVLIERPKVRNLNSIFLYFIDIAIVIVLMLTTQAEFLYLLVFLLTKEVAALFLAVRNLKVNIFKIKPAVGDMVKYAKFGILPMFSLLLMTVNYRISILMLEPKVSLEQIGIFSLGVSLSDRVWLIPDALKDILLSKLAKGKSPMEVARVIRVSLFFCVLSIIAVVLFGRPAMAIMFGPEFDGAYNITLIMLFGVISMIFYKMVYSYNLVNGHGLENFIFLGISAVLNVIGNYFLIPLLGITGAALTSVCSYTVCGMLFLFSFVKHANIPFHKILFATREDFKMLIAKITPSK